MLGFLGLLAALWMAPACETGFCRCVQPPAVAEARTRAAAVFTGTVVSVQRANDDAGAGDPRRVMHRAVLRVDRVWKGVESDTLVVVATTTSMCGFRFEPGETYLVYASPWGDAPLTTSICSRTKPLDRAGEDLGALGEPVRRWR